MKIFVSIACFLDKDIENTVKDCLDHNNTTINYDYSKKFTSEYTPISTILKNEKDYYVGHRVNTKKLYILIIFINFLTSYELHHIYTKIFIYFIIYIYIL